jgi:hypothetical protein
MRRYLGVCLLGVLAAGCALQAATSGRVAIQDGDSRAVLAIGDQDRALIQSYYGQKKKAPPPGLAKRQGNLPPGLAKRERLPPGLQGEALPYDLERQLAPLPREYVRLRVGPDVVLLEVRTRVVHDVVYDVAI